MSAFLVTRTGGNGLTYQQTRRVGFSSPTRGVRMQEQGWLARARAIALVLPQSARYSHLTAAQLWGLYVPTPDEEPFHVTVARGTSTPHRGVLTVHRRANPGRILVRQGVPVTDPVRTWLDAGSMLPLTQLVALTDQMVRRRLVRRDQLVVPPGCRGAVVLRQASELADPRSQSPRESALRVYLVQRGVPVPEVNLDVVHQGEWIGCGDLVWPRYRVYVEYDGIHHDKPAQRHQDAMTRNRLTRLGWTVLVITDPQLWPRRLEQTLTMIEDALRANGWTR